MDVNNTHVMAEIDTQNRNFVNLKIYANNEIGFFDQSARDENGRQISERVHEQHKNTTNAQRIEFLKNEARAFLPKGFLYSHFAQLFNVDIDIAEMIQDDEICSFLENAYLRLAKYTFFIRDGMRADPQIMIEKGFNPKKEMEVQCYPLQIRYFFTDTEDVALRTCGLAFLEFFEKFIVPGVFESEGPTISWFITHYKFFNFENPVDREIVTLQFWLAIHSGMYLYATGKCAMDQKYSVEDATK